MSGSRSPRVHRRPCARYGSPLMKAIRAALCLPVLLLAACGGGSSAAPPVQLTEPTPCKGASFGAPLQAKDAPGDVHVYTGAPTMQIDAAKLYLATIRTPRGAFALCLQPQL